MTLSVRLTEEQSNLVEVLRTEKKLSSYISLLMSALLQDRVSTTQFLLGLSDQSVAYNELQDATIRANLYEKWLSLNLDMPFADWVSTLRSVEIEHFSGLEMPSVDVKSSLLALLDELGLELIERGSTLETADGIPQSTSTTQESSTVGVSTGVNPLELKDLVASMVQEILATTSSNVGREVADVVEPTEPLVAVETLGDTIELDNKQKQESTETVGSEGNLQSISVSKKVETSDGSKDIDPIVDTSALMSGFGLM